MSELVERVRVALQKHQMVYGPDYEGMARAAIAAMRAPDKKMLKAACAAMSPGKRPTPKRVSERAKHGIRYRAMIDAALAERSEAPQVES